MNLQLLAVAVAGFCLQVEYLVDSKLGVQTQDRGTKAETRVVQDVQAYSLLGHPLKSVAPTERLTTRYEKARQAFVANPDDPTALIWLGRFEAYCGRYDRAIKYFGKGIERFPKDARFLRHRGHRYITIRQLDKAVSDLEKAAKLIEGKKDQVEPDGMPNAKNIPVSSLHTNIWYHLGLAYYLQGKFEKAAQVYEKGLQACQNDDMRVAFIHWAYMSYRLIRKDDLAKKVLEPVKTKMNVIESFDYHKLCLMYKGLKSLEEIQKMETPRSSGASEALQYGIANWLHYEVQDDSLAHAQLLKLVRSKNWPAFGCIAAESSYRRRYGRLQK